MKVDVVLISGDVQEDAADRREFRRFGVQNDFTFADSVIQLFTIINSVSRLLSYYRHIQISCITPGLPGRNPVVIEKTKCINV